MTTIRLHDEYLSYILDGLKITTIRRGRRCYSLGPCILETENRRIEVDIVKIRYCKLSELSSEDALRDGFQSLDELRLALSEIYPDLLETEEITIVFFKHENQSDVSN